MKFGELLIVFCTLLALGLAGPQLKLLERTVLLLAAEAMRDGYLDIDEFDRRLTGQKNGKPSRSTLRKTVTRETKPH